jgi:hypothetical protein
MSGVAMIIPGTPGKKTQNIILWGLCIIFKYFDVYGFQVASFPGMKFIR